ncbi:hypothetical protein [Spirosoma foliorum]|uniref:Uncharacterized protein n=1 Tax=Spirosoma foliorum TaxID=2710596 RepID=A0A7G5GWQ4_9BACT|nr:hypothetical protein [Spirosoma foliorum]QMW03296.1 hypothetical protein H3H32_36455 [Spirosoma foliorum]
MRKNIFMFPFYLFLIGVYLYYCQSKYFPAGLYKFKASWSPWLALAFFAVATGLFVREDGWVSGILLAVCALSLALMLSQFVAVLGRTYFYSLVVLAHGLVLIDLLS